MNKKFNSEIRNLLTRIVLLSVFNTFIILFANPIYGTTDDYILSSFVDGSYTGSFEKVSIFIEPLVSVLLFVLQNLIHGINFYSLFMLSIVTISLAFFGSIISRIKSSVLLEIIWLNLSIALLIWFILRPTYTSAAWLGSFINLLSLMIITNSRFKNHATNSLIVFLALLFGLSYLIRPESGNGVLLILVIFLIGKFIYEIKTKTTNNKAYIIIFVTLGIVYVANLLLSQSLKNEEWQNYNSWNSMRHQIQQRLSEDVLLDLRTEINWTIPEYHMFMNLSFGDEKVFNSKWLEPAFNATSDTRGFKALLNSDSKFIISKFIDTFNDYKITIFLNIFFLLLIISIFKFSHKDYIVFVLSIFITGIVVVYISVTLHTPARIIIPLLLTPVFLTITSLLMGSINLRSEYFKSKSFIFIIIAFSIAIQMKVFQDLNLENKKEISKANSINKFLMNFNASAIYVGPVGVETYHLKSPYKKQDFNDSPKMFIAGNWETFSPHWFERMKTLGLTKNSLYDNLFDQNVYWISYSIPDNAYLLELYLREKSSLEFRRENIKTHQSGLSIYQFIGEN